MYWDIWRELLKQVLTAKIDAINYISIKVPCNENLEAFDFITNICFGFASYKRTVNSWVKFVVNFVLRHFEVETFCCSREQSQLLAYWLEEEDCHQPICLCVHTKEPIFISRNHSQMETNFHAQFCSPHFLIFNSICRATKFYHILLICWHVVKTKYYFF